MARTRPASAVPAVDGWFTRFATSLYQQGPLPDCACSGVQQSGPKSTGPPTTMTAPRAGLVDGARPALVVEP